MATQFLNHRETFLNLEKFPNQPRKANLKPTWAILLSTFIYVSVFYAFNLSPTALLSTTKFWFLISNTLVLIIATDSGAFSKTKGDDLYLENNIVRPTSTTTLPTFQIDRVEDNAMPNQVYEEASEKIIDVVVTDRVKNEEALESYKHEVLSSNKFDDAVHQAGNPNQVLEKIKEREVGKCVESNLDEQIAEDEDKLIMVQQMTLSERHVDQDDDFSSMSVEELNRRVEEFIRRFNGQIRLRAGQNF